MSPEALARPARTLWEMQAIEANEDPTTAAAEQEEHQLALQITNKQKTNDGSDGDVEAAKGRLDPASEAAKRHEKGILRTVGSLVVKYRRYWVAFVFLVICSAIGGEYSWTVADRFLFPCLPWRHRRHVSRPSHPLRQSHQHVPAHRVGADICWKLLGTDVVYPRLIRCSRFLWACGNRTHPRRGRYMDQILLVQVTNITNPHSFLRRRPSRRTIVHPTSRAS